MKVLGRVAAPSELGGCSAEMAWMDIRGELVRKVLSRTKDLEGRCGGVAMKRI